MRRTFYIILPLLLMLWCCVKHKPSENIDAVQKPVDKYSIQDYADDYFGGFINEELIGKEQVTGNPTETEYFTTYLGIIQLGRTNFHVLAQFYSVQAAIVKHGHSRIVMLDENKKLAKVYDLSMPDELPVSIISNELVFNIDGKYHDVNLGSELPQMICLPEEKGCY